jgi:hypothetical protein|tara:strand:+ start:996 stop:1877 length:882 start_codon:yes stop_codon:yes gene_type:complete
MGYKRPTEVTRNYLENQPLPNHGKSYTVISHKEVIDNTMNLLSASGFSITKEVYRSNMSANVAQGIYHIRPINPIDNSIETEEELGMMFSWTNSYDKSTRFQCAVGAYVLVCSNGMVAGDMMNYNRKHTGTANMDTKIHMSDQIKNAEKYYKRLISDKDYLKTVTLSCKNQSELIGRLFIDEDLLDTQQVSMVKKEMEKPSFDYGVNSESAWAFYNHVTHALKKAHPRDWLGDQQNFHDFITTEVIKSTLFSNVEVNTNYNDIDVVMEDIVEIPIDEDITEKVLVQEMYMGRI